MKLRPTKTGVSLQLSLYEWHCFKKLVALIWCKFDVSDKGDEYSILNSLVNQREIEYYISKFYPEDDNNSHNIV